MDIYKPYKGTSIYYILGISFIYDFVIVLGINIVNSYILSNLLRIFLIALSIYQVYYLLQAFLLKYGIDNENVYILSVLRKIKIPLADIECYAQHKGSINGVKLSGFASNNFAFGKSVVKKIGTTNSYITSNKNIFYLKSGNINYAISPGEPDKFEQTLRNKGIEAKDWEYRWDKNISLHKDKAFIVPLILNSVVITILTLNPFILYLLNKLPVSMPLTFDSAFMPVDYGTGKQFAFNQMIYGVLNMAILFCMYYASYFYAKYDKRSSKKFIYVSLVISLAFLFIQIRILRTF